jgi:hypothetical protein
LRHTAVFVTSMLIAAGGAAAQTPLDADGVYLQTIAAMRALPQPESVAYVVDASGSLHVSCEGSGDDARFRVNIGRGSGHFAILYYPDSDGSHAQDLASHQVCKGHGSFSPMPDLRVKQHPDTDPGNNGLPIDDGLRYAINDVRAMYTIALKDAPPVEGHPVYRLVFTRRSRAKDEDFEEPLREILVDAATSRIREIKFGENMGNFMGGLGFDADIKLGPVGDYWVVTDFNVAGTGRLMLVHKRLDLTEHAHDFVFLNRKQARQP